MSLNNFGLNFAETQKKEDSKIKKTTKKTTKKSTIKKEFKPLIKEEPKIIEKPKPIEKEIVIQTLTKEEIKEIMSKKEEYIEEDSENVNGNHLNNSEIKSTEIRIKKFIHHEAKNKPISAKIIKSYLYLSNEEFNKYIPIVLQNYSKIKQIDEEFYIWQDL